MIARMPGRERQVKKKPHFKAVIDKKNRVNWVCPVTKIRVRPKRKG